MEQTYGDVFFDSLDDGEHFVLLQQFAGQWRTNILVSEILLEIRPAQITSGRFQGHHGLLGISKGQSPRPVLRYRQLPLSTLSADS